jgi:hypothetical protein
MATLLPSVAAAAAAAPDNDTGTTTTAVLHAGMPASTTNGYNATWFVEQQNRVIQALDGNQDAYESIVSDRTPLEALYVLRQQQQSENTSKTNNGVDSASSSSFPYTTQIVLLYLIEDIIVRRDRPLYWSHLRDAWVNLSLPQSPWHYVVDRSIMLPSGITFDDISATYENHGDELWKVEERIHRALRLHEQVNHHKRRKLLRTPGPTATQDAVRTTILVWLAFLENEDDPTLFETSSCRRRILEWVHRWGVYTVGWTYKLSESLQLSYWMMALTTTFKFHIKPEAIQDLLLFRPE